MTPTKQQIAPLRQRMLDGMRTLKLSDGTQRGYIRAVRRLAAFLGHLPWAFAGYRHCRRPASFSAAPG